MSLSPQFGFAQGFDCTMTGQITATTGSIKNYSVSCINGYSSISWSVSGTTNSYTLDDSELGVLTVQWLLAGTYTVEAYINGVNGLEYVSKTVTVSGVAPATPTASFNPIPSNCGNKTISYTGTPPGGVTWYWQTSNIGTSTTNSSTSYVVSISGTYYLRAYSGGVWSINSQTGSTVTILSYPSAPSVDITSVSLYANCAQTFTVQNPQAGFSYRWYTASTGGTLLSTANTYTYSNATAGTYNLYVATYNGSCESSTRTAISIVVNNVPTPVLNPGLSFTGNNIALSVQSPMAGLTYQWFTSASGGTAFYTGTTYTVPNTVTTNTTYYVAAVASGACVSSSRTSINLYALPVIQSSKTPINGVVFQTQGESAPIFSLANTYTSYSWKKDGLQVSNNATYQPTQSGVYTLTVSQTDAKGTINITSASLTFNKGTEGQDLNYIISRTIQTQGITQTSQIDALAIANNGLAESITYFDGLGREMQSVITQGSFTKKDIVQPIVYDAFGRQPLTYLPYTEDNTGRYKSNALTTQATFYNQGNVAASQDVWSATYGLPQTLMPFSESVFEASPSSPVLEKGAVGRSWQVSKTSGVSNGTGRTVKIKERVLQSGEVVFRLNMLGYTSTDKPIKGTDYSYDATYGSPLWVTELTDEHNNQVLEYKNELGQVILKKVQKDATTFLSTYYVYDEMGHLRYVLPPKAVDMLQASSWVFTAEINELIFYYLYDEWGRMIEKKVPSAASAYMVYDKLDRVILTQDASQLVGTANKWLYTKYDVLGRPIMTGAYIRTVTRDVLQSEADGFVGSMFESRSTSATFQYYTITQAYPSMTTTTSDLLSVTYYDNYNYNNDVGNGADVSHNATARTEGGLASVTAFDRLLGKITGSRVKILSISGTVYLTTSSFYDDKYRPIQAQTDNYVGTNTGGKDILSTEYDFAGRVMKTYLKHNRLSPALTTNVFQRNVYDHAGRVLETYQNINNAAQEERIARLTYNELGQVIKKELGMNAQTPTNPLQTVDFRYNIRGWLTHINDAALTDGTDLFGMELIYDQNFRLGTGTLGQANFNGNITGQKWKSQLDAGTTRSYTYEYDRLNRLTNAEYSGSSLGSPTAAPADWNAEQNRFNTKMTYDNNGNILTLIRSGLISQTGSSQTFGVVDNLTYTYYANQLRKVEDAISSQNLAGDFKNGITTTTEYNYYNDGSLKEDKNKGITSISYNVLNMPKQISFGATNYISNIYDAAGIKLRKEVYENVGGTATLNTSKTIDYAGGIVYEGGEIAFISTPEGRALPATKVGQSGNGFVYEYHYKDHLGNLRVSFRQGTSVTKKTGLESDADASEFANVTQTRNTKPTTTGAGTCLVGSYAAKTNTAYPMGPWKSFAMSKGDAMSATAKAYYFANATQNNTAVNFNVFVQNWAANGATNSPEANAGNSPTLLSAGITITPSTTNTNPTPTAYLRYIFYNQSGVPLSFGTAPISGASTSCNNLSLNFTAPQAGTLQVYVANESNTDVWFDEVSITLTQQLIAQENHYDPWGLNLVGIEKNGNPNHRYQFMGVEKNTEFGLNWTETAFRSYDAQLGRFHQVDAMAEDAEDLTPYRFGFNNPILFSDPSGLWEEKKNKDGKVTGWTTNNLAEIKYFFEQKRKLGDGSYVEANKDGKNNVLFHIFSADGRNSAQFERTEYKGNDFTVFPTNKETNQESNSTNGINHSTTMKGPGFWEGIIPVWGSGKQSYVDFSNGQYFWGSFNALVAVSDVFLVKSIATGVIKGGWKFGSHTWNATRSWYAARYGVRPGQPVHHWFFHRNQGMGRNIPDEIKNQPWNLLPVPEVGNMSYKQVHDALHNWGGHNWNILKRLYYGTPTWPKATVGSVGGRSANNLK